MNKISALWQLFKVGSVVTKPEMWKKRQIDVTVISVLILAIVNVLAAFGYAIPIDTEVANTIAGGILAIVNVVFTLITSDKVGITPTLLVETKNETDTKSVTNISDISNP